MTEETNPELMTIEQVRSWAKGADPALVLKHIEWRLAQGTSPAAIAAATQLVTDLRIRSEAAEDAKKVS